VTRFSFKILNHTFRDEILAVSFLECDLAACAVLWRQSDIKEAPNLSLRPSAFRDISKSPVCEFTFFFHLTAIFGAKKCEESVVTANLSMSRGRISVQTHTTLNSSSVNNLLQSILKKELKR